MAQQHDNWLGLKHTQDVIKKLERFRDKLIAQAENLTTLYPQDGEKIKTKLIESNNIKRLIQHLKNSDKYTEDLV